MRSTRRPVTSSPRRRTITWANAQDIAYQGNELFVSDTNGLGNGGGTNVLDVYDASTLAVHRVGCRSTFRGTSPAWPAMAWA